MGRILSRVAGWLGGHDFHYAGYLPSRPGFLLRYTLDPFFRRVKVHPRYLERLRDLASQGAVVYALNTAAIWTSSFLTGATRNWG